MIVDKADMVGEHAWTKLLNEHETTTTGKGAVITKMMSHNDNSLIRDFKQQHNNNNNNHNNNNSHSSEASPLTSEHNTVQQQLNGGSNVVGAPSNGTVSICLGKDDINDTTKLNANIGDMNEKTVQIQRKESLLGTFHKHLRRSIKAVSESPGPITRYENTKKC
uniref:Uncharacterized protein n=1 Tax=Glossina brevipalpis TaxID=37001 RepID=A0A1A9X1R6_9MUSC